MIISSLRTTAFRNLSDTPVASCAKNIFLVGENGQGKTNFMEALYWCSYGSSFRGVRDSEMAKGFVADNGEYPKGDFSAAVSLMNPPDKNSGELQPATDIYGEVLVKSEKGRKSVFLDGKKAEDRRELLSVIPCIVFCHEDMEFVAGSPERRRWFFDQVLSLYDPVYLDDFRRYRRVLKSRNSVLRDHVQHRLEGSPEPLLDALDPQCAAYGTRLMEKREEAARLFSGIFTGLYEEVAGISGITVRYSPSWKTGGDLPGENEAAELLQKKRSADMAAGASLSGPHRDRYIFAADGVEFAGNASTGQRRLLALLLRVAQARSFSDATGRNPILLLDDVLLEMDGEKRRRFLAALPGYDQAFYTFLPEEPYQSYCSGAGFEISDTLVYHVKNGIITAGN